MSHLSEALRISLDRTGIAAYRLAQMAGLGSSTVDTYVSGRSVPKPEALGKILNALPATEHAALLIARLRDELPGGYEGTVTLAPGSTDRVQEDPREWKLPTGLSPQLRTAIMYLAREAINLPEVRDLIITLSDALGATTRDNAAPTSKPSSDEPPLPPPGTKFTRARRSDPGQQRKPNA